MCSFSERRDNTVTGETLLEVKNLTVSFPSEKRGIKTLAVDNVSLCIYKGETLGLVGESGCGKTTLGRAVCLLRKADRGSIIFDNKDFLKLRGDKLKKERRRIQMIFQNPYSSLNPRMTVLDILSEALVAGKGIPPAECSEAAASLMRQTGLDPAVIRKFPHEFSGGQRQRIAIARALAAGPSLVIADEPVSSLDVSVAAQILTLLRRLRESMGLTMLFISHDLSIVRYMSQRTAVMFKGRIVESGSTDLLFRNPAHPYTRMLLDSVPVPDPSKKILSRFSVPQHSTSLMSTGGCPFRPRCSISFERCALEVPELAPVGDGHLCACFRAHGEA
jgi:oligopeptide/dipeptide ABC transporter ATP-binding protein